MKSDAKEMHEYLVKKYECNRCEELGNNGCGTALFPGGYEFWFDDNSEPCDYEYHYDQFSQCLKEAKRNQRAKEQYGASAFEIALKVALSKAPSSKAKEDSYGDIVRSAAAVAVAALGKLQPESDSSKFGSEVVVE